MVLMNPLNRSGMRSSGGAISSQHSAHVVRSQFSPWLTPIAYGVGCWAVLPFWFRIQVTGQENIPEDGAVILAPTHRSRWDALIVPYATGRFVSGRDIHFMVTSDEFRGFQGWLIKQLGGFPVNPRQPAIASLRHGMEILRQREMMVIFPEGGIFRDRAVHPLKPGLARLALQAEASEPALGVKVVPISLQYSQPYPEWGCEATVRIGKPIEVAAYQQFSTKQNAKQLTTDLESALRALADEAPHLSPEAASGQSA